MDLGSATEELASIFAAHRSKESNMGKGDIKTKKGKRIRGSYGKTRKRKSASTVIAPAAKAAPQKAAVKKPAAKKAAPKTAAKKTTAAKKPAAKKTTAAKKPAVKKAPAKKTADKK